MSIDFKLNYRSPESNDLSDRIIRSADPVFAKTLSDDYVQKFLMNGWKQDAATAIAHRRHKDASEMLAPDSWFVKMAENMKNLTDDQTTKQLVEQLTESLTGFLADCNSKFDVLFGRMDPKLVNSPVTMSTYVYQLLWQVSATSGTFLDCAVVLLAGYIVGYRVAEYVRQRQNCTDNEFVFMLCYEQFNLKPVCELVRQMIDTRADKVSKEEEAVLCDLMQRVVAIERMVQHQEFSGREWSDA